MEVAAICRSHILYTNIFFGNQLDTVELCVPRHSVTEACKFISNSEFVIDEYAYSYCVTLIVIGAIHEEKCGDECIT